MADSGGPLRAMAVFNAQLDVFELLQLQTVEGPSVDCIRSGKAVIKADLRDARRTVAPLCGGECATWVPVGVCAPAAPP